MRPGLGNPSPHHQIFCAGQPVCEPGMSRFAPPGLGRWSRSPKSASALSHWNSRCTPGYRSGGAHLNRGDIEEWEEGECYHEIPSFFCLSRRLSFLFCLLSFPLSLPHSHLTLLIVPSPISSPLALVTGSNSTEPN